MKFGNEEFNFIILTKVVTRASGHDVQRQASELG